MAAVQMTCARVAMATDKGLAGALRKKLPRSVVMAAAFALFVANTFNIAADLAGMADAAEMLSGIQLALLCYSVRNRTNGWSDFVSL
jgi:Mn2+/Fe2+ NRAMP family transporter